MSAADILRRAVASNLTDEDGEPITLELDAPLSAAEIDDFARSIPCPLPNEVRELLQVCRGFRDGYTDAVDFTGGLMFELETVFPYGLPIAADGFGNFWVVDLMPDSTEFGPIYYACHDAPVILYQSDSLADFLTELFKMCAAPYESLIDDVHEDRLYHVWRTNPGALSYEACRDSDDAALRAFAEQLGSTWVIVDLRAARPGMGFSWGRFGPNAKLRRYGPLPIFAYERRPSLWKRLFGP
jgi:cell wall assembly regulator SMI1